MHTKDLFEVMDLEKIRVVNYVDELRDYIVDLTKKFVEISTINPPGEYYEEFANTLTRKLEAIGVEVESIRVPVEGLNKFNVALPRVIVVEVLKGLESRRTLVLNGHCDVAPTGSG